MAILFLNLQITRLDIRPHIKWAVILVIAYGHFNIPQGFVWVCMAGIVRVNVLILSPPRGKKIVHRIQLRLFMEMFHKDFTSLWTNTVDLLIF